MGDIVSGGAHGSDLLRPDAGGREERLGLRAVLLLFARCLRLLRPVRKHILALCAALFGLALALLPVGLILFDAFWTRVLQGEPVTALEAWLFGLDPARSVEVAALERPVRELLAVRVVWTGVVVGALVTPAVVGLWYYQIWILQRINQILRVELVERFQALSLRFHSATRVGDAIYRLFQDSAMVTQLIDLLVLTPIFAVSRFVFSTAVVFAYSPRLALWLLLVWPPLVAFTAWFSRPLRLGFRAAREANSALTSRIQETLAGIRVIKAFGAEGREQARFEADSSQAFAAAFSARSRFAVFSVGLFWIVALAMLATAALAALETRRAAEIFLVVAGFAAWNLGLFNFFKDRFADGARAGRHLFRTWGLAQDVAIGLDRVFEILDLEPEVQDAPDAIPLEDVREGVRFRDLHFRYGPDVPVVQGVSLEARLGTVTAIVGPTGSGKSTLMALLLRLFDPDSGQIEIDGVDLRRFRVASLRARVAIALQENLLFGATVRENIRFGAPDASDAQVREAARIAGADAFIEALPEGYDTLLGERGTKLSTGQRQRLSIARAVVKQPRVLILDEPTASLDAETERRVLDNLAAWGRDRVILLITHRLSTIRRADQIVVLEAGRVVEAGSHAELLARGPGVYRRLLERDAVEAAPTGAGLLAERRASP
jgi:ABC-type multidrug transport system fused ATPase/permease subunit